VKASESLLYTAVCEREDFDGTFKSAAKTDTAPTLTIRSPCGEEVGMVYLQNSQGEIRLVIRGINIQVRPSKVRPFGQNNNLEWQSGQGVLFFQHHSPLGWVLVDAYGRVVTSFRISPKWENYWSLEAEANVFGVSAEIAPEFVEQSLVFSVAMTVQQARELSVVCA
jgi:hypothetical protein